MNLSTCSLQFFKTSSISIFEISDNRIFETFYFFSNFLFQSSYNLLFYEFSYWNNFTNKMTTNGNSKIVEEVIRVLKKEIENKDGLTVKEIYTKGSFGFLSSKTPISSVSSCITSRVKKNKDFKKTSEGRYHLKVLPQGNIQEKEKISEEPKNSPEETVEKVEDEEVKKLKKRTLPKNVQVEEQKFKSWLEMWKSEKEKTMKEYCYLCKEKITNTEEGIQCQESNCGNNFHKNCLNLEKDESFLCDAHFCQSCNVYLMDQNEKSFTCKTCPNTFCSKHINLKKKSIKEEFKCKICNKFN